MFESWLEQEKAAIKSRFGNMRIYYMLIAILAIPLALMELVLLLDGGGIMELCAFLLCAFVICFALSMSSYKSRFVKPLLASIRQELPTEEDRRTFAQQMQKQAVCISYRPHPSAKSCDIMLAEDYCYTRQPKKSRIFHNNQFRRATLTHEKYYTGYLGHMHMRWCYALALYASDPEKPVWKGYFTDQNDASRAFARLKTILPPEAVAQDFSANSEKDPKTPLWKTLLSWAVYILILAAMFFLLKHRL